MRRLIKGIKFFEEETKLSYFIAIAGAILIFWISAQSFGAGTSKTNLLSILYHILFFFFFSFFVFISLIKGNKYFMFLPASIISAIYAISDEVHQYFVPGRSCNIQDFLLDTTGIFLAFLIYSITILYRRTRYN
jgi:VanZ family protein